MITARFENGMAQADRLEGAEEAYQVTVFSDSPKHDYQSIMDTISWGNNQGFVVMSSRGKPLESVMPEYEGKSVKQFRFVKVDE
jgi:hypothetical protein|tara:strand:+ start:720 stop:971 length:252 start_codon:yes stop_codon:yes gene_type:complete